jgi:hypothetical protein
VEELFGMSNNNCNNFEGLTCEWCCDLCPEVLHSRREFEDYIVTKHTTATRHPEIDKLYDALAAALPAEDEQPPDPYMIARAGLDLYFAGLKRWIDTAAAPGPKGLFGSVEQIDSFMQGYESDFAERSRYIFEVYLAEKEKQAEIELQEMEEQQKR